MWVQPEQPHWQEWQQDVAQPPAPLQPLGAQCVAAETAVGRTASRLLAAVPGSPLLVAAAGPSLLLLSRTGPGSILPLGVLFESSTGISAVAVSSTCGQRRQWAAALEGGSATFCPIDTSGADPAAFGGSPASPRPTSVSLRPGAPAFEALAWHPSEAVCALLAPHELLLVAPPGLQLTPRSGSHATPASARRRSSSSSGSGSEEEGGPAVQQRGVGSPEQGGTPKDTTWGTFRSGTVRGDWGSLANGGAAQSAATVLLALPSPMGTAGGSPAGRCCLAWLGSSGGEDGWCGGSVGGREDGGSGSGRRLVLSWGGHLELLQFGEGAILGQLLECLLELQGLGAAWGGFGAATQLLIHNHTNLHPVTSQASLWSPDRMAPARAAAAAAWPTWPSLRPGRCSRWPPAGGNRATSGAVPGQRKRTQRAAAAGRAAALPHNQRKCCAAGASALHARRAAAGASSDSS